MSTFRRRHQMLQVLRRCTQLGAIAVTVTLIFVGLYHHYAGSRALDRIESLGGWRGAALTVIDDGMGRLDDPDAFLANNNGNIWSMRLGGFEISDPLALVEASAASGTIHTPLLISILLPVVLTVLLGRVFCSWLCPGYVLFELAGKLRTLLEKAGFEPARVEFAHSNKYALLLVGVLVAAATGLPFFSMFYPPALLSRTAHGLIFGTGVAGMLASLGLIVTFEIFVSPRWWCRSMCAGGALYGLLGAGRALRVTLIADRCTACKLCHPACQEGINPVAESSGLECDNCGACIRSCPDKALVFTLGIPGKSRRPTTGEGE